MEGQKVTLECIYHDNSYLYHLNLVNSRPIMTEFFIVERSYFNIKYTEEKQVIIKYHWV